MLLVQISDIHCGLEKFSVKGWNGVKTHVFLYLILRLMHAIACHKHNPLADAERHLPLYEAPPQPVLLNAPPGGDTALDKS